MTARPPSPPRLAVGFTFALFMLASSQAAAQPGPAAEAEAESVARAAVQERRYAQSEELRLAIGSMPLDPFQKGWTASLSYTHHLDDLWAWEIVQVTAALLTSTSLRDELIGTFARRPEEFAAPRFMVTTGAEVSPFYGKQVLFNRDTLHATVLLGAYAGVIFGDRADFGAILEDLRPAVGAGLGFRVFATDALSIRLDSRLFAAFRRAVRANESAEVESVGLFTLSASFGFGGRP